MVEGTSGRRIVFTPAGWEDYRWWRSADPPTFEELTEQIHSLAGGEEPADPPATRLSAGQPAVWSRRVRGRHRLVYALDDRDLIVLQARYQEG